MIPLLLSDIAIKIGATLQGQDQRIEGVSTDTRDLTPGALFVALCGEHFDGHDFCSQAVHAGAGALLVNQPQLLPLPQLVVADTIQALGKLAAYVRELSAPKVVAITGSCGKTSVKEMLACILEQEGLTLATAGNFNNEIGVPLTLLRLTPKHRFAIIELGANHIGEIAYTTALARPDVALVTNIAAAHLEGFGSLEGVAAAKFEIFSGLDSDGFVVLNRQQFCHLSWQQQLAQHPQLDFALDDANAKIWANEIILETSGSRFQLSTPKGDCAIKLEVPGRHNIANALAAASAAFALGIQLSTIASGLARFQPVKGRLTRIELKSATLIDDTYNASVASVSAAIDVLKAASGYRILVLADMAELGEHSETLHQQIGDEIDRSGIDQVLLLGKHCLATASRCQSHWYPNKSVLIGALKELISSYENVVVLVKGSRSMEMEQVVSALTQEEVQTC